MREAIESASPPSVVHVACWMPLSRLNFPFFMRLARPWVRAFRRAEHAGPGWGPLSLYPQIDKGRFDAISALVALPFGR